MKNLKRNYTIPGRRNKVYGLTDELLSKGYGIRKHLRGWELYLGHTGNHIYWSTSLKLLDEWISFHKQKLQGEI